MREHFHVPDNYFLSHSVGCLPRQTRDAVEQAVFGPWQATGGRAWPSWMDALEQFRVNIGALLGAPAAQICPQTNVSSALTKILHALPDLGSRKTILCTEHDFPTVGFVFKQAEKAGFNLRFLAGDEMDIASWADAIDESVGIVHVTHAFSNTSRLAPVQEVCALARKRGQISIVDIAQSAGIIPIELTAWAPDFAIGTGVKFLCAGPGACFMFASEKMIAACNPLDVGWFSHEDPFAMDIHDFRLAPDAMRFFGGTPSPTPLIAANAALETWAGIGLQNAQTRAKTLLAQLVERVPSERLVSPPDTARRGGTLVVEPASRPHLKLALNDASLQFDERAEGLRFSVHGYTSEAESEKLGGILAKASG